eukprot:g3604.t1
MKNNYGVPWSSNTAEYMRGFQGFNIDIVKIAAVDCLYRTNFYFGLIVVIAVPCAGAIFILLLHRCGKLHWMHKLKHMPRKCVRSGVDVRGWMPAEQYLKLRRESAKKSLLADAIPDDIQSVGKSDKKSKWEERKALREQMGNLTGIPPGTSIAPKFYDSKAIIDATHVAEVLEHNIDAWKNRLVERMEYMRYTNKCWKLLFWMMLLGYPSIAVKTLRTFSCVQVGQYRVLAQDMGIECSGATYWWYVMFAAVAGGSVIVGVPLIFITVLLRARDRGVAKIWRACLRFPKRQEQLLREAKEDAKASGFFWTMDRDGDGQTTLAEKREAIKNYLRRKNMRFHRTYQRLGFIYYSYREGCWWYEVVELSRKLVLNGLMVLVSDNNAATRVVAGIGACFAYLLFMNYVRPYKCGSDFLLQNVCHVQLFLTALCGLLLKAEVPFLGFEPRFRPTEKFIIEVVIISSHVLTCVFALGTVIWEKFFSTEIRRVQARRAKATLERKQRMAKWGRAKKAVLMGVRGSLGMKSFGGIESLGIGVGPGGKATEGGAVAGIIGALSKGSDATGKTKIRPKKKVVVTEGFLAAARERAAAAESKEGSDRAEEEAQSLEAGGGVFAFPDDERDINSTVATEADGLEKGLDTSASEFGETSAGDSSSSSDSDTDANAEEDIETKDENKKSEDGNKKSEKADAVELQRTDETSSASDSDSEDDALTAAQKSNAGDEGKDKQKTTNDSGDQEKTIGDSEDKDKVEALSAKTESEDTAQNARANVETEPNAASGHAAHSSNTMNGESEESSSLSAAKLSVEDEMVKIKEEVAAVTKSTEDLKSTQTQKMNQEKRAEFDKAGPREGDGGVNFAWDDESDSASSSESSAEDISSDDE